MATNLNTAFLPPVKARERKPLEEMCGGLRHDFLTVIGEIERPRLHAKTKVRWAVCKCDCGNVIERDIQSLSRATTIPKSCGCKARQLIAKRREIANPSQPEYRNWTSMRARCSPSYDKSEYYYEKGIKVCEKWDNDFQAFLIDMGRKPSPSHTIDRIDVNKDYEPSNCRWATSKEQQRNKTNTIWVLYKGVKTSMADVIEGTMIGHKQAALMARNGATGEEIIQAAYTALEKLIKV